MSNTLWQPQLAPDVPVYRAIADALERDISEGVLVGGSRLPTHRELAVALRVTPLTITRAYKEAARRGLVEATVGRGTFIRDSLAEQSTPDTTHLDLSKNVVMGAESLDLDARALDAIRYQLRRVDYEPAEGTPRHRAAAATWMRRSGLNVSPDRIVITPGAHQAMLSILGAVCRPGDVVLTEELTYPRFAAIAGLLHLEIRPVELDEHGVVPAAFEKAARGAKALYFIPNFQNPTGSVMPERRRREIAAIAQRRGILLLEDDVYGFLHDDPPAPVTSFAPETSCYLTSISKSLTPSLRLGFAALPESIIESVTAAFAATTAFTSSVSGEIFTQLLERGQPDRIIAAKRRLIATNRRAAERGLDGLTVSSHPFSPHLWIELGPTADGRDIADRARTRGIEVCPAAAFAPGKTRTLNAVRAAIGATDQAGRVESAMRVISSLIRSQRLAMTSIV